MVMVDDDGYAIFVTPTSVRAFRLGVDPDELDRQVDALRNTISIVENSRLVTYPFDVELAFKLYGELFQPIGAELAGVRHLIVEPDGAMLRLPANLLVTERRSEEHTSELQSLMRISYAVFCLKKKTHITKVIESK